MNTIKLNLWFSSLQKARRVGLSLLCASIAPSIILHFSTYLTAIIICLHLSLPLNNDPIKAMSISYSTLNSWHLAKFLAYVDFRKSLLNEWNHQTSYITVTSFNGTICITMLTEWPTFIKLSLEISQLLYTHWVIPRFSNPYINLQIIKDFNMVTMSHSGE